MLKIFKIYSLCEFIFLIISIVLIVFTYIHMFNNNKFVIKSYKKKYLHINNNSYLINKLILLFLILFILFLLIINKNYI